MRYNTYLAILLDTFQSCESLIGLVLVVVTFLLLLLILRRLYILIHGPQQRQYPHTHYLFVLCVLTGCVLLRLVDKIRHALFPLARVRCNCLDD